MFCCALKDGIKTKSELRSTASAHTRSTNDYRGGVLISIDFYFNIQSSPLLHTGRRWGAIKTQNVCLFIVLVWRYRARWIACVHGNVGVTFFPVWFVVRSHRSPLLPNHSLWPHNKVECPLMHGWVNEPLHPTRWCSTPTNTNTFFQKHGIIFVRNSHSWLISVHAVVLLLCLQCSGSHPLPNEACRSWVKRCNNKRNWLDYDSKNNKSKCIFLASQLQDYKKCRILIFINICQLWILEKVHFWCCLTKQVNKWVHS